MKLSLTLVLLLGIKERKAIDLEDLPSHRKEKRAKLKSSKPGVVKPGLPILPTSKQPPSKSMTWILNV